MFLQDKLLKFYYSPADIAKKIASIKAEIPENIIPKSIPSGVVDENKMISLL